MPIKSEMPPNYLILCCPLLLRPSIFPSIMVFSNEVALCIRWPKDWHFSFSISPSREYSGLVSFRTNWFDLSLVQGSLRSLLQHQNSKSSIILYSAFFMVKLSHMYMTTKKKLQLWLYGPLLAKWCLCFLTWYLGWSGFASKEQARWEYNTFSL